MRSSPRWFRAGLSLSVSTLFLLTSATGCSKVDELMGKKEDSAEKTDESKTDETKEDAKAEGGEEAKADAEPVKAEEIEPIPVEEMHTGLDLMLKLVPQDHVNYVIVRDATVLTDYIEEGVRFVDGPLEKLGASSLAGKSPELTMASAGLTAVKPQVEAVTAAIEASGVDLKQGVAFFKQKGGGEVLVFHAADPNAMKGLVTALGAMAGESAPKEMHCKAIEGVQGFNACADAQAALDAYKPREDPADLRTTLGDTLGGMNLDEVNVVAHVAEKEEVYLAVSTIPGMFHLAASVKSDDAEMKEMQDALAPAEAKTLASVAPGAGFIWANLNPKALEKMMSETAGAPPQAADFLKSLNGEVLFAGSIDPGGFILTMGVTDVAKWDPIHQLAITSKDAVVEQANKGMADLKGAKFVFDEVPLSGGGAETKALHVAVTDLPEAEALKAYTGLHPDGWAFAANNAVTVALGPDKDKVAKLLEAGSGGPSEDLLATLPPALGEGLKAKEVSAVMHVPVDFLHGKQMHEIVKAALKSVPDVKPEDVLAATSLLAPFSSGTIWVAQPAGKPPVFHVAVRGVGNRETEEGKAALDAAHTVADGGDPEAAFADMATKFAASPMAYAYKARAGTDGPAYLVGSGIGAVMAAGAMFVPVATGARNETLAADLGVKPEEPPPELKPTAVPEQPKVEKKPPQPKKPKKPKTDPKADPKADPTEDPKVDPKADPVVEPKRPLPPKPTEDPKKAIDPTKDPRNWGKRRPGK